MAYTSTSQLQKTRINSQKSKKKSENHNRKEMPNSRLDIVKQKLGSQIENFTSYKKCNTTNYSPKQIVPTEKTRILWQKIRGSQ